MPQVAPWQTGDAVWAPDIKQSPNGTFLLYYTDRLRTDASTHCIGAATSDNVTGPFHPLSKQLICPHGGAIDPTGFLDRSTGKRYIVYKVDGNSLGNGGSCHNEIRPIKPTPLMLQEVDPRDGVTFIGTPTKILDRDVSDGPLVEAPALFLSAKGVYFLFYSSGCYTTSGYHISYATATNIKGPYTKAIRPLLMTGDIDGIEGPGGMDILHSSFATNGRSSILEANGEDGVEVGEILFHGIMTINNDRKMREMAEKLKSHASKPAADTQLPFVRGMYSGKAFFRGKRVKLANEDLTSTRCNESHSGVCQTTSGTEPIQNPLHVPWLRTKKVHSKDNLVTLSHVLILVFVIGNMLRIAVTSSI